MYQPLTPTPPVFTQTPVEPEPPKRSYTWLIVIVIVFLLTGSSVLAYKYYQLKQQVTRTQASPSPAPLVSPKPSAEAETANWKTYTNSQYDFSFRYPTDWQIEEKSDKAGLTISPKTSSEGKYFLLEINILQSSEKLTAKQYVDLLLTPSPDITDVLTFNTRQEVIVGQNYSGEELLGVATPVSWKYDYIYLARDNKIFFFAFPMRESNPDVFNPETNYQISRQILSTFKFLDDTKPEPSPARPLEKIPTVSTNNWKSTSNNGIQFKIPPEANCNDNQTCTLVSWTSQYQGNTLYHSIRVEVKDYLGGSRREQFYQNTKPECHDIYQEASFGPVKALQIAIDGGWCQGGGGGIVTVINNKLVIIHNLFYNPETKVIDRWDIRDTLVSTLKQI